MALPFLDSTVDLTLEGTKQKLIDICVANGLPVTDWPDGEPSERWLDITPRIVFAVLGGIVGAAFRGFFFDFATDPGDPGDTSEDQTPRAGLLSALGAGWFFTFRGRATYATTTVTIQNNGSASGTFNPYDLTFTTSDTQPDGGHATYRNTTPGSTTLAVGASVTLAVVAEQLGSLGNAGPNTLALTTQSFATPPGSWVVTSSATATGQPREDAGAYKTRCKLQPASRSPGGPQEAYLRAMNTGSDGEVLQRYDGTGPVQITDAYVSPENATGLVTMYIAGATPGAATQVDLDSCNANILGLPLGVITDPLGVLPDTVTIGPYTYGGSQALPFGTPGAALVTDTTIDVTYSVYANARKTGLPVGTYTTGGSPPAAVASVFALIEDALADEILGAGIGGRNQTAGAGFVYTEDLRGAIKGAAAGLYDVAVTTPGGATTAINVGHRGALGTPTGTMVVV